VSEKAGMVMTASDDGMVKFWKRTADRGAVEFVKSFKAHVGSIVSAAISGGTTGGSTAATVGSDGALKFYDMATFDVSGMIKTGKKRHFGPASCFVLQSQTSLAVSTSGGNSVEVYDTLTMESAPSSVVSLHPAPVTSMFYADGVVVTGDGKGVIEYWDGDASGDPKALGGDCYSSPAVGFTGEGKMAETDLYSMAKKGIGAVAMASARGRFAVYGSDRKVRLFDFSTGKVLAKYDDTLKSFDKENDAKKFAFDSIEYGRRAATEREIGDTTLISPESKNVTNQKIQLAFDETGRLLLYPTLVGIKIVDTTSHRVVRTIGGGDASQNRFLSIAVCGVDAKLDKQMELARNNSKSNKAVDRSEGAADRDKDPMIICTARDKKRFFVFNKFESEGDERDVFNEPPDAEDMITGSGLGASNKQLGKEAVLRTSVGDIHIKLFGNECPRTVENFCGHSRSGYYEGTIMHRVIKGFMIQMGDPKGDGTGGESIWGGEFEDEIHRDLRHDRPFTVSMANAGPGTNGSQFFITTVPTPWLDGKHTVFGRVTRGMDIVVAIENAPTDHLDKPLEAMKILGIEIE